MPIPAGPAVGLQLFTDDEFTAFAQQEAPTATLDLLRDLLTGQISELGDFSTGYPTTVKIIALRAAARAYFNPQSVTAETVGPFTVRRDVGSGVYLTDEEKAEVRKAGGATPSRGLWTQPVTRSEDGGTVYVPTGPEPSGYPFPWYADDVLL